MPRSKISRWLSPLVWLGFAVLNPALAQDWPPVTAEELALKDNPVSPGAAAVILLLEEENDDSRGTVSEFFRIKVLAEEGKKYADVEIHFLKGLTRIDGIEARVVKPNGEEKPFRGEIFEKVVSKRRDLKILNKTFALPEVEVGCIIDVRYKIRTDSDLQRYRTLFGGVWVQPWIVQRELPILKAEFSLRPLPSQAVAWTTNGVDANVITEGQKDRFIRLTLENIPAFVEEDHSPPADFLKMRVDFFYMSNPLDTAKTFWQQHGKDWNEDAEDYIGRRKKIEREARALVSDSDSSEQKLRKIYERVQQIRNLSWEEEKTSTENKREKLKDNDHIEDVLKHGYGYRREINRLFVGLVRAAGFEAGLARVCERDDTFFRVNLLDPSQLNYELALVKLNGEDRYFDPGTPFCPFGALHWSATGVSALRLDESGGEFAKTPIAVSTDAVIQRMANTRLDEEGRLEGRIEVLFEGHEASIRRLDAIATDETGRRQRIEREIQAWLPTGAVFELDELAGMDASAGSLRATGTVEIADFGVSTGRRLIVPLDLFSVKRSHPFPASSRVHPVYYRFPYQHTDEVTIQIPAGMAVESVPKPEDVDVDVGAYSCAIQASEKGLHLRRVLSLRGVFYPVSYYPQLRSFFDMVRTGDQQQAVLASEAQ